MTSVRSLIDRLYDGELDERLRTMRAEGLSYRRIALALGNDGFDVTGETVRLWCLNIDEKNAS